MVEGEVSGSSGPVVTVVLTVVVVAVAGGVAASAAIVDLRTHRIPNRSVSAVVALVGVALLVEAAAGGTPRPFDRVAHVLGGAFAAGLPMLIVHLRRGVGLGDVKFAAALGALAGLVDARLGLVLVGIAALAAGTTAVVRRVHSLALGPWLWGAWAGSFGVALAAGGDVTGGLR